MTRSGAVAACGTAVCRGATDDGVPSYLRAFRSGYRADPRAAALRWFTAARFGLFVHYGRRSLPNAGRHARLEDFTARAFDADAVADLAVAANMAYVNFTVYHGGGPYLFDTKTSRMTSCKAPVGRDLLAELAAACRRRGRGLFVYIHISIGRSGRNFDRNRAILRELLTGYGPLAGTWFDSVLDYRRNPDRHPRLRDHFSLVRRLQPQCLVSFKQGVTGREDFRSMEHHPRDPVPNPQLPATARKRFAAMPAEICTTMQLDRKGGSGTGMWFDRPGAYHRTAGEVMKLLDAAAGHGANLLLNTGLRGDGSIHPADGDALREVGRRLRRDGWPEPAGTA